MPMTPLPTLEDLECLITPGYSTHVATMDVGGKFTAIRYCCPNNRGTSKDDFEREIRNGNCTVSGMMSEIPKPFAKPGSHGGSRIRPIAPGSIRPLNTTTSTPSGPVMGVGVLRSGNGARANLRSIIATALAGTSWPGR